MADTGSYARRIHGFVQTKLRQTLYWRCASPVTPAHSLPSLSYPIVLSAMQRRWHWMANSCAARRGRRPVCMAPSSVRSPLTKLLISVTTPTRMGAFFRNEGGRLPSVLPRMEEETQGVTPPFKEEVAWGRGGSL